MHKDQNVTPTSIPIYVSLDDVAGLGPAKFSSCAVSTDGRLAYFGRTASYDPEMRNLVVASLDPSGNVVGIPQCYPTSAWPLALIEGYPATDRYNTTITAIVVNSTKNRLYMGESRSATQPATSPALNVYMLDAGGNPIGTVRTYPNANDAGNGTINALLMHPDLPLLYMVGQGMTGVAVQALDSNGDPKGAPVVHQVGQQGKHSLGISADAKYLYLGTYPDTLEVVALDSNGNPTSSLNHYTVSNHEVGTVTNYLQFTMGAHAIYMVRPSPNGSNLPILALWPLNRTTGQPVGNAIARADIHLPLIGESTRAIAVDSTNSRLWVASLSMFTDAFLSGEVIVSGITPTEHVIKADGTLGDSTAKAPISYVSNAAILVPAGNLGHPLFFNSPAAPSIQSRAKGYKCRVTVIAAVGGSFPLTMTGNRGITFGKLEQNAPSPWVELDTLVPPPDYQTPIGAKCAAALKSITVQLEIADPAGTVIKSVVRKALSNQVAFPMIGNRVKGYQGRISVTAVEGSTFPLTTSVNYGNQFANQGSDQKFSFEPLSALNTPTSWVSLDALLQDEPYLVPIKIVTRSSVTSMTVRFDLADPSGRVLRSVAETVRSNSVAFLAPGYAMDETALAGDTTGFDTYSQRGADYLLVANRNPVALSDRPKKIITDCYQVIGAEASDTALRKLAQAIQAIGFNTVNAYGFDGLSAADINVNLNDNGLFQRSVASYVVGKYGAYAGAYFSFDKQSGMTMPNLANWAKSLVDLVANSNGGSASQIVSVHMTDEPAWYYPSSLDMVNDTTHHPGYLQEFRRYLQGQGLTYAGFGATNWDSLYPVGQSVGNPSTGPAKIEDRRLYYWTMRFFVDAAVDGMKLGQEQVTKAIGHPVITSVNWNNFINRWYIPAPNAGIAKNPVVGPDSAMGGMDWMRAGRTSAHTAWTEDWFDDTRANIWSVYAAVMRSATQAGTQSFGGYVVGQSMGRLAAGGKYKILTLLGNGAKSYCGYTFGPWFEFGDGWSEDSSASVNRTGMPSGKVYSEFADANRLIGRSENILFPGLPERSKVAILLPSASALWDTKQDEHGSPYYALELYGLYFAISHGFNISADFVDDTDVADGALTERDYHVLYVVGPNISAAAQAMITNWIKTWGEHNRQLVLVAGAGVADEYNTPTTGLDTLAGLIAGSRSAFRDAAPSAPSIERFSATIRITNSVFYFNDQKMNIRGPFHVLLPLSGSAGPTWTDQEYTTSNSASQPGCMTKEYRGGKISNFVTCFGFFPGWQYYASPDSSHTNHLPQGWSVMAREIALMPVVRQNPPRTVHVYSGIGPAGQTLTEANAYLTTCPVEALRLNVGGETPTAIGVVLLNWGGAPISALKLKVLNGIANPTTFALASHTLLSNTDSSGGINVATLALQDVDVVLIST
jgi:hypothetical protein